MVLKNIPESWTLNDCDDRIGWLEGKLSELQQAPKSAPIAADVLPLVQVLVDAAREEPGTVTVNLFAAVRALDGVTLRPVRTLTTDEARGLISAFADGLRSGFESGDPGQGEDAERGLLAALTSAPKPEDAERAGALDALIAANTRIRAERDALKAKVEELEKRLDTGLDDPCHFCGGTCACEDFENFIKDPLIRERDAAIARAEKAEAALNDPVMGREAEMLRVKACEHIAEGDPGWEKLANECPSTAAVATLRRDFEKAEAEVARLTVRARDLVFVGNACVSILIERGHEKTAAVEEWKKLVDPPAPIHMVLTMADFQRAPKGSGAWDKDGTVSAKRSDGLWNVTPDGGTRTDAEMAARAAAAGTRILPPDFTCGWCLDPKHPDPANHYGTNPLEHRILPPESAEARKCKTCGSACECVHTSEVDEGWLCIKCSLVRWPDTVRCPACCPVEMDDITVRCRMCSADFTTARKFLGVVVMCPNSHKTVAKEPPLACSSCGGIPLALRESGQKMCWECRNPVAAAEPVSISPVPRTLRAGDTIASAEEAASLEVDSTAVDGQDWVWTRVSDEDPWKCGDHVIGSQGMIGARVLSVGPTPDAPSAPQPATPDGNVHLDAAAKDYDEYMEALVGSIEESEACGRFMLSIITHLRGKP